MDEIKIIIERLKKIYPMSFYSGIEDPFYVLISTILSQRTKDEQTIKAAKQLFSRFKTPTQMKNAEIGDIKKLIRITGFYNVKAKRVKEVSKIISEKYKGKVPEDIDELVKLPGVGYKTAACVMVYGFNKPEIPVDVHVAVISQRLGIAKEKTPEKIRLELMKKIERKYWLDINELFVKHGKEICLTRKPKCELCAISNYCDYYNKIIKL